jgi:hypothetical protein
MFRPVIPPSSAWYFWYKNAIIITIGSNDEHLYQHYREPHYLTQKITGPVKDRQPVSFLNRFSSMDPVTEYQRMF